MTTVRRADSETGSVFRRGRAPKIHHVKEAALAGGSVLLRDRGRGDRRVNPRKHQGTLLACKIKGPGPDQVLEHTLVAGARVESLRKIFDPAKRAVRLPLGQRQSHRRLADILDRSQPEPDCPAAICSLRLKDQAALVHVRRKNPNVQCLAIGGENRQLVGVAISFERTAAMNSTG